MTSITTRALGQLVDQLDRLLAGVVPPTCGGAAMAAWHPGGLPLELCPFGGDPAAVGGALDALADATAHAVDGWYRATPLSASHLYDRILAACPGRGGRERGEPGRDARPVTATPADWWDVSAAGNWTPYSASSAFTSDGRLPRRPRLRPGEGWAWQVLPAPLHWLAVTGLDGAPATLPRAPLGCAGAAARGALVLRAHQVARLATVVRPASVAAPHLRVSFDYCYVSLSRPWWDGVLLGREGWPGPGAPLPPDRAGLEGPACPGVPIGLVLARNLRVAGAWSEGDRGNLAAAASFGPFSLLGRAIGPGGTITVPGVQLVAWVLHFLPTGPWHPPVPGAPAASTAPAGRPPGG